MGQDKASRAKQKFETTDKAHKEKKKKTYRGKYNKQENRESSIGSNTNLLIV